MKVSISSSLQEPNLHYGIDCMFSLRKIFSDLFLISIALHLKESLLNGEIFETKINLLRRVQLCKLQAFGQ